MIAMKKLKTWSDIIATWFTILGVIGAGIFSLIEYRDHIRAERVKETLGYVARYNGELQSTRMSIDRFWSARAKQVFSAAREGDQILKDLVVKTTLEHGLDVKADILIEFFNGLHTCTMTGLCDEPTVRGFFGKTAFDFFGLHYPYLEYWRVQLQDPLFGCGLENLAKSYIRDVPLTAVVCGKS